MSLFLFVGQNGNDGKIAFVLDLVGDDLENHVQINENGEVYLKVDKIVAIPKDTLSHFAYLSGLGNAQGASAALKDGVWMVYCPKCGFDYDLENQSRTCPHPIRVSH